MPMAPGKACSSASCPNIVRDRKRSKCPTCEAKSRQQYNATPARREDQKFYGTARWRRIRAVVLSEQPCCQDCAEMNPPKVTAAQHVDHIVPRSEDPSRELDLDNLRALCHACHSRKTMKTMHADGRFRGGSSFCQG